MAGPQRQREDAALLDIEAFEHVGHEFEPIVIADEPRIAVDRHHPDIALVAHQHAQRAAMATGLAAGAPHRDDARHGGHALADRRQELIRDRLGEVRAVDQGRGSDQGRRNGCLREATARKSAGQSCGRAERERGAPGRM